MKSSQSAIGNPSSTPSLGRSQSPSTVTTSNPGRNVSVSTPEHGHAENNSFSPRAVLRNIVQPVISGNPRSGSVLTVSNGVWIGSPYQFTYQWRSGNSLIGLIGNGQNTYTVQSSDIGLNIVCVVTAYSDGAVQSVLSTTVVGGVSTGGVLDFSNPTDSSLIAAVAA